MVSEIDNLHVEDHYTALASTSSAPVQETNDFPYLSELGQDNIKTNIEMTPAESIVMQCIVVQKDQGSFILFDLFFVLCYVMCGCEVCMYIFTICIQTGTYILEYKTSLGSF